MRRQWFDQRRPRRDERVGALGERGPDEELEVAQLVAAERQRQEVLALDPDVGADRRARPRTGAAGAAATARRPAGSAAGRPSGMPTVPDIGPRGRMRRPRPYLGAHGHPHHPGRSAHDGRPASGHGALDRDLAADRSARERLYSSIVSTAPGDRTRIHHHGECETSIYILSGAASLHLGPDRPRTRASTAATGDFIYIPAGEIHVEANASATEPLVVLLTRNCPDSHVVYLDGGPDGADDVPAPC